MKSLKKFLKYLVRIQNRITVTIMLIIPIMVFIQVLLRYVFKAPLMGIEELLLFPTIWLYMLGGAMASEKRSHITCGILILYIKTEKGMNIFNIIKAFFASITSLWLTYWAFWYFSYSLRMWKYSAILSAPMFFAESAIFIGLVLMTFYSIYELYERLTNFRIKYLQKAGVDDANNSTT